jgi:HlyD family secretion protein
VGGGRQVSDCEHHRQGLAARPAITRLKLLGFGNRQGQPILVVEMSVTMDRPIRRRGWRARLPLLAALAAGAVALAVTIGLLLNAGSASVRIPADQVTVSTVQRGVFRDQVTLRAKVAPRDVFYLDALEGGQVLKVLAQGGDVVAEGQPLVQFRNTELELEVLDREGRLVESITQLQAYEKQLEDARVANAKAAARIEYDIVRLQRTAQRRDVLAAKGFTPRDQLEAVHDELAYNRKLLPLQVASNREQDELRRRQLPQIRAELASLQQSLKITRSKLDNLVLRAPVGGRLAAMDLKTGEIRNRGQRLGQIVPDTGFKLEAQIDEYYLDRVRTGLPGEVEANGRTYPVRLVRFDPQVKDSVFQGELVFVRDTPAGVLPGQALEGRLSLGGDRPALVLPAGGFLERTGGSWAMVVDRSGRRAQRRAIRIGRRNSEQVEVLGGLKAGERVITSDYTGFEKVERVDLTR